MKKVIGGKVYNTDTSELVHLWTNGLFTNDFNYRDQELHRTKKGAWFIKHSGGPMTDMAVPVGNATSGSNDIEVINEDEAFDFLESDSEDGEAMEAIEKYFPGRIQEA